MYDIPYFKAAHPEEVLAYMKAHPFALLCGVDEQSAPVATQIPVLFEQRGERLYLQGHIMRKQDHTNAFLKNPHVLFVFTGAHSYISASWYEDSQVASTWNYQSVQAAGVIEFKDLEFLFSLLSRLTESFEKEDSPSLVKNLSKDYVDQMMKAIIGFEVEVKSVRHVFKLSQNRNEKTKENIIAKLREQDADEKAVASAMEENSKNNS